MKILFLSNFYPPYVIGGYEALCLEVVEGLAGRGYETVVLTSIYGVDQEVSEAKVHRLLTLEGDLHFYRNREAWSYHLKHQRNLSHLRRFILEEMPDIIFIWGMWNLSKYLAQEVEQLMGSRVVYYLANPWPIERNMHQAYWDSPVKTRTRSLLKQMLSIPVRLYLRNEWKRVHLHFEHALCCSSALRDQLINAGVTLQNPLVIYEGINLDPYLAQAEFRNHEDRDRPLTLVFVGILAEHKGVHTAIEALNWLSAEEREHVRLAILGKGHPHYQERLQRLVHQSQLSDCVSFYAPIPRSELPAFLGNFDVLLLPSIWSEPLARIMQEGLASGMVVIGSANGGTAETISHGENGLLFTPGDANDLAQQIRRLLDDLSLRRSLSENGKRTAVERFDIDRMVSEIECYLKELQR